MTPEQERQAEMTFVLMLHKMDSRQTRRQACKSIGCEWEEYQRLKQKYSHLLKRYDFEQYKKNGRK